MMFSIDTNIVFGVINRFEKLHNKSISIIHAEIKINKFILFDSVISESIETFSRKSKKSFAKAIEIFSLVDSIPSIDKEERIRIFSMKFDELKSNQANQNLRNFMELISEEIKPFITKWDMKGAFEKISEYGHGLDAPGNIIEILHKNIDGNKIEFFWGEYNKEVIGSIESAISQNNVKFDDSADRDIFVEVVLYSLFKTEDLKFYSNDKEFMEKSKIIFSKIPESLKSPCCSNVDFKHIEP